MQTPGQDRKLILAEALERTTSVYALRKEDVMKVLGLSQAQFKRLQHNGVDENSKTGELVLCFLRVICSISAMTGNNESKARHWLTSSNKAFSGKSPMQRMMSIEGLMDVLRYCDASRIKH